MFCFRSFKICAYFIPVPDIITMELTVGLFFRARIAGILGVYSLSRLLFFFFFYLCPLLSFSTYLQVPGLYGALFVFSACPFWLTASPGSIDLAGFNLVSDLARCQRCDPIQCPRDALIYDIVVIYACSSSFILLK